MKENPYEPPPELPNSGPPVDSVTLKRAKERRFLSLYSIGGGVVLMFLFSDYVLAGTPIRVPWVGGGLVVLGVLGLLGVNVFAGGPLDKRLDNQSRN